MYSNTKVYFTLCNFLFGTTLYPLPLLPTLSMHLPITGPQSTPNWFSFHHFTQLKMSLLPVSPSIIPTLITQVLFHKMRRYFSFDSNIQICEWQLIKIEEVFKTNLALHPCGAQAMLWYNILGVNGAKPPEACVIFSN